MKCEEAQRLMPLYIYGEVAPGDEERLEAHVHACEGCRRELRKLNRFGQALDEAAVAVPEGMLTASRLQLRERLAETPRPQGFRAWMRDTFWFRMSAAPLWVQVGTAAVLIGAGFVSGRFGPFAAASEASAFGRPVASQVRSLEPAGSGRVQLVVDETRERVLTGSMQDEAIRGLLLAATRDVENPALRVQCVELLKSNCHQSSDIRAALASSLQHDPDPGVRLEALDGLKEFASDPQIRTVFSQVLLSDRNPGVRAQVIGVLLQQPQEEMVGVLQELIRGERDQYVRQKCTKALQEMNASSEEY